MGSKVAWSGLGLIFGLAPFLPVVLVAGEIILVIGVILIIIDK
jgi:hypothetical protein